MRRPLTGGVTARQAKTSVLYLPQRLATTVEFREAVAAIQDAHHKLHLAETYPKELRKHLSWTRYPHFWIDHNYWDLYALRRVVDQHVDRWAGLTPASRLGILERAHQLVEDFLGPDNRSWKRLARSKRDELIKKKIDTEVVPGRTVEGLPPNNALQGSRNSGVAAVAAP